MDKTKKTKLDKKLESIRKAVGGTVIFRVGMTKANQYDLLAMDVIDENTDTKSKEKQEAPCYIG